MKDQKTKHYRGRFAPSPSGPLHLGSLTTALGSWLDARTHGGIWLVRIEDLDAPRVIPGADQLILAQLKSCGLEWDEQPVWQSQRSTFYKEALHRLIAHDLIYACQCSRKIIGSALLSQGVALMHHEELIYPGTCREKKQSFGNHALRIRLPKGCRINFADRRLGKQTKDLNKQVGDFVLRRGNGLFAYQLAVVVDDHLQDITHVVRGEDLLSNTARQIYLQHRLGYETPSYLHLPLVTNAAGEKLSKQSKAPPIQTHSRQATIMTLNHAARYLGIECPSLCCQDTITQWLKVAIQRWAALTQKQN